MDQGIRTEEVRTCPHCGEQGNRLYRGLRDRHYGAPGRWSYSLCPDCGLLWLSPRPSLEDIGRAYPTNYSTHEIQPSESPIRHFKQRLKLTGLAVSFGYDDVPRDPGWTWVWRVVSLVPAVKEMVWLSGMCLSGSERGTLLDIGCGNGQFIAMMRGLGWDALGIEPDAEAARIARDVSGVPVIAATLEEARLPDAAVDVVTMHHVFEHVADPASLIRQSYRVLKPGGKLVIVTPNAHSLGHRLFKKWWEPLEPPRHLSLWPMRILESRVRQAGFSVETLQTSSRGARLTWSSSRKIRQQGTFNDGDLTWWSMLEGLVFQAVEEVIRSAWKSAGEEIVLVARKGGQ